MALENCAGCGKRLRGSGSNTHCAACRRELLSDRPPKFRRPPAEPAILKRTPLKPVRDDPAQLKLKDE